MEGRRNSSRGCIEEERRCVGERCMYAIRLMDCVLNCLIGGVLLSRCMTSVEGIYLDIVFMRQFQTVCTYNLARTASAEETWASVS